MLAHLCHHARALALVRAHGSPPELQLQRAGPGPGQEGQEGQEGQLQGQEGPAGAAARPRRRAEQPEHPAGAIKLSLLCVDGVLQAFAAAQVSPGAPACLLQLSCFFSCLVGLCVRVQLHS